jgi:glutaredoxin
METIRKCIPILCWLTALILVPACAERSATPPHPEHLDNSGEEKNQGDAATGEASQPAHDEVQIVASDSEPSGLVDLQKAKKLLETKKHDDLLEIFEPDQIPRLSLKERGVLADIFYAAANTIKVRYKDISYSSLFCERGLMLMEHHEPLLKLQIRNYLHPDMKLFGGAEELAIRLVQLDGEDQENQFLRGKVAFDQGEWDIAVNWLKKAARVGRTKNSKMVKEAWRLLDLAKGHQEELKSALSMTRELEVMLKRAKTLSKNTATQEEIEPLQIKPLQGGEVTLYMTRWCGYCRKTRELLKRLGVTFKEKDIEKDKQALMEMMRLAQKEGVEITGVPVIRIGSRLVVGYNRQLIEKLVKQIQ